MKFLTKFRLSEIQYRFPRDAKGKGKKAEPANGI